MSKSKKISQKVAVLGIFGAVTVVCQLLSYMVKIGTFNLSLVLIPIVLVAVIYGPSYGAFLGGVFGVVAAVASATGLDGGGYILMASSPFFTVLVCLLKGIAAGYLAGIIAIPFKEKHIVIAVVAAALTAPIVNTGIFVAAMFFIFKDTLVQWANGGNLIYYTVFGLLGVNFVIELLINVVFSPAIAGAVKTIKKVFRY